MVSTLVSCANVIYLEFFCSEDVHLKLKMTIMLLQQQQTTSHILTTIHATTKSFIPFCSAQDCESTDMNCLVF